MADESESLGEDIELENNQFNFQNKENLFDISDSFEAILQNPINQTLGSYQREFIRNERLTFDKFIILNKVLVKLQNLLLKNPIYQESDLAKIIDDVLIRYNEFSTMLRQNVLLSKEKMEELKGMVDDYYVKISEHEEYKEIVSMTLEELEKDFDFLECKKGDKGNLIVEIPIEIAKKRGLVVGRKVALRQIKGGGLKQIFEDSSE